MQDAPHAHPLPEPRRLTHYVLGKHGGAVRRFPKPYKGMSARQAKKAEKELRRRVKAAYPDAKA